MPQEHAHPSIPIQSGQPHPQFIMPPLHSGHSDHGNPCGHKSSIPPPLHSGHVAGSIPCGQRPSSPPSSSIPSILMSMTEDKSTSLSTSRTSSIGATSISSTCSMIISPSPSSANAEVGNREIIIRMDSSREKILLDRLINNHPFLTEYAINNSFLMQLKEICIWSISGIKLLECK